MAKNVLPFVSKGRKKPSTRSKTDGVVIDHGSIGRLKYEVYKRGVIHIFNTNKSLVFKKACDIFESEIDKLSLDSMRTGDSTKIAGSGDNPDLIFECDGDDIHMRLEKKQFSTIKKLKSIFSKGAKK